MTKRSLLTLSAAALASLAVAAPASADTLLTPAPNAQNITYGGSYAVWAAPEGSGFRLVVRAPNGTVSTPSGVGAFTKLFDPSIGSTGNAAAGLPARALIVVYAREDASGDSDVYAYDLRNGGSERKLAGLSSDRYDETAPSITLGRYAVVRSGGSLNGVITGTLGSSTKRQISKAIARETASNGSRTAYVRSTAVVVERNSGEGRALQIGATGARSIVLTRYQAAWLLPDGKLRMTERFAGSGGPFQLVVKDAPRQVPGITGVAVGSSFNTSIYTDAEGVKRAAPSLFHA